MATKKELEAQVSALQKEVQHIKTAVAQKFITCSHYNTYTEYPGDARLYRTVFTPQEFDWVLKESCRLTARAYNSDKPPRIKDKAWGVFEAYKIGGIQLLAASTPIADYKLTRTEALEKALEYAKAKGVQPHYHPPK